MDWLDQYLDGLGEYKTTGWTYNLGSGPSITITAA